MVDLKSFLAYNFKAVIITTLGLVFVHGTDPNCDFYILAFLLCWGEL